MSTRLLVALGCAMLAADCTTDPTFAFRSQQPAASTPLQRLQVYSPIVTGERDNPVTAALYDAFQASLVFRLSLCRVAAEVHPAEPLAVGSTGIQPPTLTIRIADKQVVATHLINQFHQEYGIVYSGTLYFGLELVDPRSRASMWSARSSFKFPAPQRDDEIAGTEFARGIVTQLQRDGWLTACVHEAYPGCLADRREERRRMERIVDDLERVKALNGLPDCK